MTVCAFVAPYLLPATARFVAAAAHIPGVDLVLVTAEPAGRLPAPLPSVLAGHWRVDSPLDPAEIAAAVRGLSRRLGPVRRLFGSLEELQVPLAQVREALGICGMDVATARNFRDKARMKQVLQSAGVPCARHALATSASEAAGFVAAVGLPVVVKPPSGAGARSTFRIDDEAALRTWLQAAPPTPEQPAMIEQFLAGTEGSFDAVAIDGEIVWHSISDYRPTPLDVLRNPWIQWTVLLPRDIDTPDYRRVAEVGAAGLTALGLRTGLAHLEWFRLADGTVAVSEAGVRPPGAQITTMLGLAHDADFYRAWAALMALASFTPPVRAWSVGTAYLRGIGTGVITGVRGLERLQAELGHLVVDRSLPRVGAPTSGAYEGDGYVIVRDRETGVVSDALRRLISGITVDVGPLRSELLS
jgi:hypothetical protein